MGRQKGAGGAGGKGGAGPATRGQDMTVRVAAEQLLLVPISDLVPYANNARVHSKEQINQIRASLRQFGFVTPVLIDFDNNIIAGHGRVEAAKAEGMTEVPCVLVANLTEAQRKAYILADNRLSEMASWDEPMLKIELERLETCSFDTKLIGFDAGSSLSFQIAQPLDRDEISKTISGNVKNTAPQSGAACEMETEEYQQFVDKFKPKLTTDDCYTPENIYTCVKDWAVKHYRLEKMKVLRPFWPGENYQNVDYSEDCVVIDNPPFSILSDICRWYNGRGIRYFLFAPTLTLFSTAYGQCSYVLCGVSITYANGANENTSFVTNLGDWKVELAPELYRRINEENAKKTAELPTYTYPNELLTISSCRLVKYGQALRFRAEDLFFTRALDAQKAAGKSIYGAGFLCSERAAAERAEAERAVAERAEAIKWMLSAREQEIIRALGKGGEKNAGIEAADGCDQSQRKKASV